MRDSRLKTLEKAFFNDLLFEFFWPEEQEGSRKMGPVLEFFLKAASRVVILESPGGGCVTVVNGQKALEIYGRQKYHISLVILDLLMPACLEKTV